MAKARLLAAKRQKKQGKRDKQENGRPPYVHEKSSSHTHRSLGSSELPEQLRELDKALPHSWEPEELQELEDTPVSYAQDNAAKASLLVRQMDRWMEQMESLRLAEYVRYVGDRKRFFWSSFLGGVARGVGMAVGFTILGAILIIILQNLAKRNLPLIGDVLAQIVSIVQKRLQ